MKHMIPLENLSKYRAPLMGLAIICTMLCHNTVVVPENLADITRMLKSTLQCGVDMFMLLSGLGLSYSFYKNPNKSTFWKKRYGKILPTYVVAIFVYGFVYVAYLRRATLWQYLWAYSLISFFAVASLCVWFIAAILLLYALFPLLYSTMQRHYRDFLFMVIIIAVSCMGLSFIDCHKTIKIINEIFISRIPAFLVGMAIAKEILDHRNPSVPLSSVWLVWLLSSTLIVWVFFLSPKNYWTVTRLLFLPFSLSGMLILTTLIAQYNENCLLYRAVTAAGGITLELYLIHERALSTINEFLYMFDASPILLSIIANILAVLVSILGAWILKQIVLGLSLLYKKHIMRSTPCGS